MNSLTRFALVLTGSLAAAAFGRAQTAPAAISTNGAGPKIQFNTESYDFVKIIAGDPVKYAFIATNTGDAPLQISNAKGSCSCTVVGEGTNRNGWIAQTVEPGQTCPIPIEIATGNFSGQNIMKFVTVTSNDKTRPMVNLQIHGQIWVPVEISPPAASFALMPGATNPSSQVIKIVNHTDTPLTLSDPVSTNDAFSAVLKTNLPGREFELVISAVRPPRLPPSLSPTALLGTISLKSSDTNRTPLNISAVATLYPEITIYPSNLPLFAGPLVQNLTNQVTIRANSGNLIVTEAGVNFPGVNVSINVLQTNSRYNISVVFPKGFEVPPGPGIALTIKTDNPHFPVLSIPVTAIPRLITNAPRLVPPPARTGVLPPSIRTNVPASSALRANPPHS